MVGFVGGVAVIVSAGTSICVSITGAASTETDGASSTIKYQFFSSNPQHARLLLLTAIRTVSKSFYVDILSSERSIPICKRSEFTRSANAVLVPTPFPAFL